VTKFATLNSWNNASDDKSWFYSHHSLIIAARLSVYKQGGYYRCVCGCNSGVRARLDTLVTTVNPSIYPVHHLPASTVDPASLMVPIVTTAYVLKVGIWDIQLFHRIVLVCVREDMLLNWFFFSGGLF